MGAMVESAADSQSQSPRAVAANPGWIGADGGVVAVIGTIIVAAGFLAMLSIDIGDRLGARLSGVEAEQREIRAELQGLTTRVGQIEGQLRVIAPAPGGTEPTR